MRRLLIGLGAGVLVLSGGLLGAYSVAPMARPALGYVAKNVCSNVFISGVSERQALADLPDEPAARVVRTRVEREGSRVTASIPGIGARLAVYRSGYGCTLEPSAAVPAVTPPTPARDDLIPRDTPAFPALTAVLDRAFAEPPDRPLRNTRAILIVHRGRVVAERYAAGYSAETPLPGWSMTKSVMSALLGVLVAEGRLDLEADALRPEWRGADDPRRAITVRQLLHMSSGLDFDETYTPTSGATHMLFSAPDAAAVAASSELLHEPGTFWYYSSATTNLLSSVLRDVLGSDSAYHSFPRRALFEPIGMYSAEIEPDAAGTFVGSSFMYATARDWARFGLLYLNDGVWGGERILPEGWVRFSVTPAPAAPLGQYGAHWWLNAGEPHKPERRPWPELPADIFRAAGYEGQHVIVVPSRELVIVRLGVTQRDDAWDVRAFIADVLKALA